MGCKLLNVIRSLVGISAALLAGYSNAQTVANGPYYATPAWDQTMVPSVRYIVLSNMSSAAVLDRETGLVWEKTPDNAFRNWISARQFCVQKTVGNRMGWRLPSVSELSSLYNVGGSGFTGGLPGAPFVNGRSGYWTGNGLVDFGTQLAFIVSFTIGLGDGAFLQIANSEFSAWCVRGASGGNE